MKEHVKTWNLKLEDGFPVHTVVRNILTDKGVEECQLHEKYEIAMKLTVATITKKLEGKKECTFAEPADKKQT